VEEAGMTRLVRSVNGRMWTVRGDLEWARKPMTADDFEHDVSAGYGPGIVMMSLIVILSVVLIAWTPVGVVVPAWVVLALLLVFLFFPTRWALRRPWKLVAETGDGTPEAPIERWVGTVRGVFNVRTEVAKVAKNIQTDDMPGFDGPLHPVE
jgi:uncharacterized protein (DUF983 family)